MQSVTQAHPRTRCVPTLNFFISEIDPLIIVPTTAPNEIEQEDPVTLPVLLNEKMEKRKTQ